MFAGFWIRVVAGIVDFVLASATSVAASLPAGAALAGVMLAMSPGGPPPDMPITADAFGRVIVVLVFWLYFTVSESASWQATPGKRLFGLRVVDIAGQRVSFLRANARYWSKVLSWLLLLAGFLMVGLMREKQGLHDLIAGTRVLKP